MTIHLIVAAAHAVGGVACLVGYASGNHSPCIAGYAIAVVATLVELGFLIWGRGFSGSANAPERVNPNSRIVLCKMRAEVVLTVEAVAQRANGEPLESKTPRVA